MLELVLFFTLCGGNLTDPFFPGYLPLPNPAPADMVIIPLANGEPRPLAERQPIVTT